MRVDFNQVLRNLEGLPLSMGGDTLTLKFVAITALLNTYPDEGPVEGTEKARRYRLAKGIHAGLDQVEPADCELIKTLVGKTFGPPVVGPVFDAFLEEAGAEATNISPEEPRKVRLQTGRRSGKTALAKAMRDRAEAGLDQLPKKGSA